MQVKLWDGSARSHKHNKNRIYILICHLQLMWRMWWNPVKIQSSDSECRDRALIKLSQSKMKVIVDHGGERGERAPCRVEEMKETFIPPPKTFCLKVFFYIARFPLLHYCFVLLPGFCRLKEEPPANNINDYIRRTQHWVI